MELTPPGRSADCLGFEDDVEVVEELEDDRLLDATVDALKSNREEVVEEVGGAFFEWTVTDDKVVF